jgi:hypothetical protein
MAGGLGDVLYGLKRVREDGEVDSDLGTGEGCL